MRGLSGAPPWSDSPEVLRVCLRATELLQVPVGSRVLVRLRASDVDWLNQYRPLFADRRLRAVLWAEEAAVEPLVRRGVDLMDWVSKAVEVPPRKWPMFAVEGVAAAVDSGTPFAWDGEVEDLREVLAEAGRATEFAMLSAELSFRAMVRALEKPGLPVVTGVASERDAWRVRMALAYARDLGSWVAAQPSKPPVGSWAVHAMQEDWDAAAEQLDAAGWTNAALMAAWLGLEPEGIQCTVDRVEVEPRAATSWTPSSLLRCEAPLYAQRVRATAADVTEARARIRAQEHAPRDPASTVVWSEGATSSFADFERASPGTLVRYFRGLGHDEVSSAKPEDLQRTVGLLKAAGQSEPTETIVEWLENKGDLQGAIRICERWLEPGRDKWTTAVALCWLGRLQAQAGVLDEALAHWDTAVSLVGRLPVSEDRIQELHECFQLMALRHPLGWRPRDINRGASLLERMLEFLTASVRAAQNQHLTGNEVTTFYRASQGVVELMGTDRLNAEQRLEHLSFLAHSVLWDRTNAESNLALAASSTRMGDLALRRGSPKAAHAIFQQSKEMLDILVDAAPEQDGLKRAQTTVVNRIGDAHLASGNAELARASYERSLSSRRAIAERHPERAGPQRDLAVALARLGDVESTQGRGKQARENYEEAQAIIEGLAKAEPGTTDYAEDLHALANKLGYLQVALGESEREPGRYAAARRLEEDGRTAYLCQLGVSLTNEVPVLGSATGVVLDNAVVFEPPVGTHQVVFTTANFQRGATTFSVEPFSLVNGLRVPWTEADGEFRSPPTYRPVSSAGMSIVAGECRIVVRRPDGETIGTVELRTEVHFIADLADPL